MGFFWPIHILFSSPNPLTKGAFNRQPPGRNWASFTIGRSVCYGIFSIVYWFIPNMTETFLYIYIYMYIYIFHETKWIPKNPVVSPNDLPSYPNFPQQNQPQLLPTGSGSRWGTQLAPEAAKTAPWSANDQLRWSWDPPQNEIHIAHQGSEKSSSHL